MRRIAAAFLILFLAQVVSAQIADDAAIRKMLAEQKDVGVVVGVVEPAGRRVIGHGSVSQTEKRAPNGDTVFEIGSATKVFTALLLADMAAKGEVKLDDPVVKYLPETVKLSDKITLRHLATHTSGLPRLPSNLLPQNPDNPYADYTVKEMYEFLSGVPLTREAGATYEYSNLGAGLLGHVLALRAKTDYETLVRTRILEPLGMKDTAITLSPSLRRRLAQGHDENLKAASNWDIPALAGAGALRSTANDMLKFLAAMIHAGEKSPWLTTVAAAERRPTNIPSTEVALGWHILKRNGREIIWHNGGTGGYRSFVGYDPKARAGVVVLSNTSTPGGVDEIGRQLLAPLPPKAERQVAKIDPKSFDRYVGRYQLAPSFILEFTREGDRFFTQATGQPKLEMFPESETKYFLKVVDAQLTFAEGEVVLHQNGIDQRAKRLEGRAPAKVEPKEVAIDPAILDKYIGRYELAPTFVIVVTRDGNRLFAQATAQPKFEIFPMSETKFFYNVVDAQISFSEDGLVLHQNGMEMPGKRLR